MVFTSNYIQFSECYCTSNMAALQERFEYLHSADLAETPWLAVKLVIERKQPLVSSYGCSQNNTLQNTLIQIFWEADCVYNLFYFFGSPFKNMVLLNSQLGNND